MKNLAAIEHWSQWSLLRICNKTLYILFSRAEIENEKKMTGLQIITFTSNNFSISDISDNSGTSDNSDYCKLYATFSEIPIDVGDIGNIIITRIVGIIEIVGNIGIAWITLMVGNIRIVGTLENLIGNIGNTGIFQILDMYVNANLYKPQRFFEHLFLQSAQEFPEVYGFPGSALFPRA